MKAFFLACIVCVGFAFAACKKDPPLPVLKYYEGQGFLSVGQSALFYAKDSSEPIELKFVRVKGDSRCPSGADCIWEGEIVVEVLIDKLHPLTVASKERTEKPAYYNGKHIIILSATPYPDLKSKIEEKDYKVEFKVIK